MGDNDQTKTFIRAKIEEAADEYERELNADPLLADVQPSPWVYESLMETIEKEEREERAQADALTAEERRALELGKRILARRKRTRGFRMAGLAAAVALILTAAVGMTSEANRLRLLNAWYALTGQDLMLQIGSGEDIKRPDYQIAEAITTILEKTGIKAMQFMYLPQGMEFEDYMIDETANKIKMMYQYGETLFRVEMQESSEIAEHGMVIDGTVSDNFLVQTDYGEIQVYEIEAPEEEKDYVAELTYQDCCYTVYGVLPKEEFVKILENIFF